MTDSPDVDEVLQDEVEGINEEGPVTVVVAGPVRTQALPCVAAGMRRFTFTDGVTAKLLLSANPMRASAVLQVITVGGIIHLGETQAQALSDVAPQWAGSFPLERKSRGDLYACAPIATAVAPIVVTVIAENWAE